MKINSHTHCTIKDTITIGFHAGRIGLTPTEIQALDTMLEVFPSWVLSSAEAVAEALSRGNANIENFVNKIFTENPIRWLYNYIIETRGEVLPIILDVFPAEYEITPAIRCYSGIPGTVPAGNFRGCKFYAKLSEFPSNEVLEDLDKKCGVLIVHCSEGGIWSGPSHGGMFRNPKNGGGLSPFRDEAEANKAAHPLHLLAILMKYKNLKVIISHAGGNKDFIEWGLYLADPKRPRPENNWTEEAIFLCQEFPERCVLGTGYHEGIIEDNKDYSTAFRAIWGVIPGGIIYESDYPFNLLSVEKESEYQDKFSQLLYSIDSRAHADFFFNVPMKLWNLDPALLSAWQSLCYFTIRPSTTFEKFEVYFKTTPFYKEISQ